MANFFDSFGLSASFVYGTGSAPTGVSAPPPVPNILTTGLCLGPYDYSCPVSGDLYTKLRDNDDTSYIDTFNNWGGDETILSLKMGPENNVVPTGFYLDARARVYPNGFSRPIFARVRDANYVVCSENAEFLVETSGFVDEIVGFNALDGIENRKLDTLFLDIFTDSTNPIATTGLAFSEVYLDVLGDGHPLDVSFLNIFGFDNDCFGQRDVEIPMIDVSGMTRIKSGEYGIEYSRVGDSALEKVSTTISNNIANTGDYLQLAGASGGYNEVELKLHHNFDTVKFDLYNNAKWYNMKDAAPSGMYLSLIVNHETTHPKGAFLQAKYEEGNNIWTSEAVYLPEITGCNKRIDLQGHMGTGFAYEKTEPSGNTVITLAYEDVGDYSQNLKIMGMSYFFETWATGTPINNDIDLIIKNSGVFGSGEGAPVPPLYTIGGTSQNSGVDLMVFFDNSENSGVDLYMRGQDDASGILDLIVFHDTGVTTGVMPLYMDSTAFSSGDIPLIIGGIAISESRPLFTRGPEFLPSGIDDIPLYITSTEFESGATRPMFLYVGGNFGAGMNLYTKAGDGTSNSNLNLYTGGGLVGSTASIPITLWNNYQLETGNPVLYLKGADTIPITGSAGEMNLFIARDSEGYDSRIPLYISVTEGTNENIQMFMSGVTSSNENITLHISGVGTDNDNIRLFTHGF